MRVESNGVMHKKWIRNEGKTENGGGEGEGTAEKAWWDCREEIQLKKVLMLQNISLTASSANSISDGDAEYFKHVTSIKVKKLPLGELVDVYVPYIEHKKAFVCMHLCGCFGSTKINRLMCVWPGVGSSV